MPSSGTERPFAMLVGLDTLQGLQAARILHGHGIPVIAIATDREHYACRTNVCREIVYGETSDEELIPLLRKIGQRLPGKAVLYPCHDAAVAQVSRHRDALQDWYHVMLADAVTIEMLMEKERLYAFARRQGFLVPGTFLLRNRADVEQAAAELRFPCVLKPSRRSPLWNSKTKAKAYLVTSREELLRLYEMVRDWAPILLAQEWIEGVDADLYSLNCYFDRDGKPTAAFVARKLRQWPPRAGTSCSSEEIRNDTVRDEGLRLLQLAGHRGLGYIEMKRDSRGGQHYLIEANPGRPTGRSAIAEAGGVEILYSMYCDALGLPPPQNEQSYRGVKWLDLRHDLQSAFYYWRRDELTVAGWWRSLRGHKVHAVLSWTDPLPFLWDLWRVARIALIARRRSTSPETS